MRGKGQNLSFRHLQLNGKSAIKIEKRILARNPYRLLFHGKRLTDIAPRIFGMNPTKASAKVTGQCMAIYDLKRYMSI